MVSVPLTRMACPKCGEVIELPIEVQLSMHDPIALRRMVEPVRERFIAECQYEQTRKHGGR